MDQIQPTDYRDLRKRPGPREHPGPGWITSAQAGDIYGVSQGAVGRRLRRWARRHGDHGVRRVRGYLHEQDWRDFVARAEATPPLPPSKTPRPEKAPPPRYDAFEQAQKYDEALACDVEPVLSEIGRLLAEAPDLDQQRLCIEALQASPDLAHRCAAETLAAIARGEMPCRVKPQERGPRDRYGAREKKNSRPRANRKAHNRPADEEREYRNPYSEALGRVRKKTGLTMAEAEREFGVTRGRWSKLEAAQQLSRQAAQGIKRVCEQAGVEIER